MTEITVDCDMCSGTGDATHGDRHTSTNMDRCRKCGGKGKIPARPGESRETSWPFAVPGAQQPGPEIVRHKKTGGLYEVLFRDVLIRTAYPLHDNDEIMVVRDPATGLVRVWPSHWILGGQQLVARGKIQTSQPLEDGDRVAVYIARSDRNVWARRSPEMDDGRFEPADAVGAIQGVSLSGGDGGLQKGASSKDDRALAEDEAAGASSSLRDCDPSRFGKYDKVVIYHTGDRKYWLQEGRGMTDDHYKAHLYDGIDAEILVKGCYDDEDPYNLEIRDPWSPAPGIETEGQSPIAESEAPASIDQAPPSRPQDLVQVAREAEDGIHCAVVEILDWMMCEGLMRHRTAEDDGLKIEGIIRSALSLPSPQDQESRPDANSGEAPSVKVIDWLERQIEATHQNADNHPEGSGNRSFYRGQAIAYENALSLIEDASPRSSQKEQGA